MDLLGPILENLSQFFGGLAKMFDTWATDMTVMTLQFLLTTALPTVEDVTTNFFGVLLGATYGVSMLLFTGVAVFLMVVILLTIRRPQGKRISGLVFSVLGLILFGVLFRPLYSMAYELSQGAVQGIINIFTQTVDGTVDELNAVLSTFAPGGVPALVLVGWITATFSFLAFVIGFALRIAMLAAIAFMPILIALKPLNKLTNALFHGAVSTLVTCLIGPILMAFFLGLPVLLKNNLPGAGLPMANVAIAFLCSAGAVLAPVALAFYTFKISKEVFGEIESRVAGEIDIASMPPTTLEENRRDLDKVHFAPVRAMASEVGGQLQHGDIFSDIKGTAVGLATIGAAAAGHPYISAGIQAVDNIGTKVVTKMRDGRSDNEYSAPASAIPVDTPEVSAPQASE